MVQISEKLVLDFQKIFKEEFGVNYSYDEAAKAAHGLCGYFELLIKMDTENKEVEKKAKNDLSKSS